MKVKITLPAWVVLAIVQALASQSWSHINKVLGPIRDGLSGDSMSKDAPVDLELTLDEVRSLWDHVKYLPEFSFGAGNTELLRALLKAALKDATGELGAFIQQKANERDAVIASAVNAGALIMGVTIIPDAAPAE